MYNEKSTYIMYSCIHKYYIGYYVYIIMFVLWKKYNIRACIAVKVKDYITAHTMHKRDIHESTQHIG